MIFDSTYSYVEVEETVKIPLVMMRDEFHHETSTPLGREDQSLMSLNTERDTQQEPEDYMCDLW